MGFTIDDGKGRGYVASVSDDNRVNTSSQINPRIFYISRDDGLAFNAISVDSSAAAGDLIHYLKNTSSDRLMYIYRIEFHGVNAALWKIWQVTGTGSGTTITPSNLNLTSGISAEATCLGNGAVTGLTTGKQLGVHRSTANGEGEMVYFDALILGPGDAIAVEYDTGTTGAAEVDVFFHYEDITRTS